MIFCETHIELKHAKLIAIDKKLHINNVHFRINQVIFISLDLYAYNSFNVYSILPYACEVTLKRGTLKRGIAEYGTRNLKW